MCVRAVRPTWYMQVPIATAWRMMSIRMCIFAEPVCPNQASLTLGHPWCMHASVVVAWHVLRVCYTGLSLFERARLAARPTGAICRHAYSSA